MENLSLGGSSGGASAAFGGGADDWAAFSGAAATAAPAPAPARMCFPGVLRFTLLRRRFTLLCCD